MTYPRENLGSVALLDTMTYTTNLTVRSDKERKYTTKN
jgi:hypothetical protein